MCGISGFVDFHAKSTEATLKAMTDTLHHRGPDDSGYFFEGNTVHTLGLGHRRLSILDLSAHGHQPMEFENLTIAYNGEVYNFKEIRKELDQLGYRFVSDSDTEVLLKAFHRWGISAVEKFNGMFAIALYDKAASKVTLLRDRAGVKPLYWYHKNGLFMFASELKSFHQHPNFHKEINQSALHLYLQQQYIPEPHTIFQQTHKLKAGHYLQVDLQTQKITQTCYWDVIDAYNKPKLDISEEEAITHMETLLSSAFEYRMVADVPVGIFLSGGYDSSIVTALLQKNRTQKLKTFTIGFYEKGFDETPYAAEVARHLGTDHTEYYCTQKDALEVIPLLPEIYDEPFADSSAIPTTLVSRLARKEVTVALSADGGDETFAGYNNYTTTLKYHRFFSSIPPLPQKVLQSVLKRIDPHTLPFISGTYNFATRYKKVQEIIEAKSIIETMESTGKYISASEASALMLHSAETAQTNFSHYRPFEESNDALSKMLAIDYKTYMVDDILTKVDRATMSVSLEGREPLLDYRIIEFSAMLPSSYKYREGIKKYLLKKITHRHLPETLMDRPKMGFGVPLYEWFRDELKAYFLHYLDRGRLKREALFDTETIIKLRDRYLQGHHENVEKLWTLLMFEMWYEKWMD